MVEDDQYGASKLYNTMPSTPHAPTGPTPIRPSGYTHRHHFLANRKTRSVKWIVWSVGLLSGLNGFAAFFRRGSGFSMRDLEQFLCRLPGTPLEWELGILLIASVLMALVVFHETKNIVNRNLQAHAKQLQELRLQFN